ncbi:MAG: SDR family oxidoreductase [Candidatus Marinimicrobia bacterium]|nr:SDR family oxidoreductase [Candidatus Neomarinimicrobiota bacterium]MCF7904528.1 SDR family oxidoreductase [Candidatus Neomarinimicrobiota bacterium]
MQKWALILGASSGFGGAISRKLAANGYNIFGVHMDRKATLPNVHAIVSDIEAAGAKAVFYNINAADTRARKESIRLMQEEVGAAGTIQVMVHSLAFGTLLPVVYNSGAGGVVHKNQMDMTLDVMAHSYVYWAQDLVGHKLMEAGSHIFCMTSSGGHTVWPNYGAVSAAKAALEAHTRQIAFELAPRQIAANAIRAGVTDTPALRKIPGNEQMIARALQANPGGRLTTPNDVAEAVLTFAGMSTWITGNVIGVDGGEDNAG